MKQAMFYKTLQHKKVMCELCPHFCVLSHQEVGNCNSRENVNGKLYTLNYGKTVSFQVDPIEKKPLYHFYPGKKILSVGANFCNLTCQFCQNYSISQYEVPTYEITKEKLLQLCRKYDCDMLAFTYTEPTIWYEFMLDSVKFLQDSGIKTVSVTNGYINEKPLLELLPYLDAMNIDLKSMNSDFYSRYCGGTLEPVLKAIRIAAEHTHVEITNLIIPDYNDSQEDITALIDFVANINPDIPVHFSKYYPAFRFSAPPTSEKTLLQIHEQACCKLHYVYLGNIIFDKNTYCPECNQTVVTRNSKSRQQITNNRCNNCGKQIYGKWN